MVSHLTAPFGRLLAAPSTTGEKFMLSLYTQRLARDMILADVSAPQLAGLVHTVLTDPRFGKVREELETLTRENADAR